MEGFGQIMCSLILGVAFWEMDDNSDELIGGQLTRPTYDKFLFFAVQVPLPERKWVQGMTSCAISSTRSSIASSVVADVMFAPAALNERTSGRLNWPRSKPRIHCVRRVG
jgi:hypothetical protein